jgi:hypothetical protein
VHEQLAALHLRKTVRSSRRIFGVVQNGMTVEELLQYVIGFALRSLHAKLALWEQTNTFARPAEWAYCQGGEGTHLKTSIFDQENDVFSYFYCIVNLRRTRFDW